MSKMLSGSPILMGNNTIPGVKVHPEVKDLIPRIEKVCRDSGLEFYPIVVEFLTYDEISEIASYGGFPVRYPHWKFGMEYEELSRGYEYGMHRISEMVINTAPSYIYCLDSNTLGDNVNVIAHAIAHSDFFKNNIFFSPTDDNMMNTLANHGTRIRKYMARWGREIVTEFIDHVLRIETLLDPARAHRQKTIKDVIVRDKRNYRFPARLKSDHNYMEPWLNKEEQLDKQREAIKEKDAADQLDIFIKPDKDIFGYLKDHAPLKPWQQDVMSMLYEEAMYFSPQRMTKTLNEGWASFWDYQILCKEGLVSAGQKTHDAGIIAYAKHKMHVLGGKYSQNPYKLGYELFMDIEDRWNKGKFGSEYDNCENIKEREKWDKKLGLGREKIFEVRKFYNDFTAVSEFFTPEFCEEKEFFEYKRFPNGEWKIVSRDFRSIKRKLLQKRLNGGLPDIRLSDPNHLGKGWLFLQHVSDDRPLYEKYILETITSLYRLWKNCVVLATKKKEEEVVYVCDGTSVDGDVHLLTRADYEEEFMSS